MREALAKLILLLLFVPTISIFSASCSSEDSEGRDENIYVEDIIGTWNCNDNYFVKDCLYFRGDGKGLYEYGNNTATGNEKVNFTWTYPDYTNKFINVTMERYITDLKGGQVYRESNGNLILYYLGSTYTKASSDVPLFAGGGGSSDGENPDGGSNPGAINVDFLCQNGGLWKYENNYSYVLSGNTQYCKSIDEVEFSKYGTITGHFYWECSGKSGYPVAWRTRQSEVLAIGSYQIDGNVLKCVFSNVTCSGSSDIETQYWNPGETNYKNYKMEYGDDGTLTLSSGEEVYHLTNGASDSGSGSGGSTNEAPDISFYDAEPGTTSIKVTYKIWNKSACGQLSNATIYYGTSSASKSIAATISGDYITATITGLSKGTSYIIKCSVTGSSGTTTTEGTTLSTLY